MIRSACLRRKYGAFDVEVSAIGEKVQAQFWRACRIARVARLLSIARLTSRLTGKLRRSVSILVEGSHTASVAKLFSECICKHVDSMEVGGYAIKQDWGSNVMKETPMKELTGTSVVLWSASSDAGKEVHGFSAVEATLKAKEDSVLETLKEEDK